MLKLAEPIVCEVDILVGMRCYGASRIKPVKIVGDLTGIMTSQRQWFETGCIKPMSSVKTDLDIDGYGLRGVYVREYDAESGVYTCDVDYVETMKEISTVERRVYDAPRKSDDNLLAFTVGVVTGLLL